MKTKNIKFLFLCLFIFYNLGLGFSQTLRIGGADESSSTGPAPFTPFYKYSFSQVIYTQEELANLTGKQITDLTYYIGTATPLSPFIEVYMSYIDNNIFEPQGSVYSFVPLTGMTKVYSGTFSPNKKGNNTLTLQTPFTYDGSKHLLITFSAPKELSSTATSGSQFYMTTTTDLQMLYHQSDHVGFPENGVPHSNLAMGDKKGRPNTTFTYRDVPTSPMLKLSDTLVDFGFAKINGTYSTSLQATNIGIGTLTIGEIENLASPFTSNAEEISLETGNSAPLTFTYAPTAEGFINQAITIKSNGGDVRGNLIGQAYPENGWVESFEAATLPGLWRTRKDLWKLSSTAAYKGTNCIKVSATQDTLITPKTKNGSFVFYAKADNATKELQLIYSNDLRTWTAFKTMDDFKLETGKYTKQTIDLTTLPEDVFIGIVGKNISLDYILLTHPIRPKKDLYLTKMTAPSVYNEKTEVTFINNIKNLGTEDVSSYNIELRDAETNNLLKDSVFNETLASMSEVEVNFRWFPVPGIKKIYMRIVLADDTDTSNNDSEVKSIQVTPYVGVMSITNQSLNFDILFADKDADTISFTLRNTGIAPIEVKDVKCSFPFGISEKNFHMDAKESKDIKVFFRQSTPAFYTDSLVFVFEGIGDSIVKVQGLIQRNGDLFESFENAEFPPLLWRKTFEGATSANQWKAHNSSTHAYKGNFSAYQTNRNVYDTLITPKLRVKAGEKLSFYAKNWGNNNADLKVMYSTNLQNWIVLDSFQGSNKNGRLTGSMQGFNIDLPEGEYFIGFGAFNEVMLDYILGPQIIYSDKDLKLISSSIPIKGNMNHGMNIRVLVQNLGNLTATDYKIQVVQGNNVLAERAGDTLKKLQKKELSLEFIPTQVGLLENVFVRIFMEGEEDLSNNDGPLCNILVNEEFFGEYIVGETTETENNNMVPFSTNYKYSLENILYYASELEFKKGAQIKGISYFYKPNLELAYPVRLWIGETNLTTLETTWIGAEDLQQVIMGDTAKFISSQASQQASQLPLNFTFEKPYTYQGGNLVILAERGRSEYKNNYYYSNKDLANQKRSRYYQNDNPPKTYDTTAPIDYTAVVDNIYPMTLFIVDNPVSLISGYVKNDEGAIMVGAAVSLQNGAVIYKDTTDENGYFEMKISATSKNYNLNVVVPKYIFTSRSIFIPDTNTNLGDLIVAGELYTYTVFVKSAKAESLAGSIVEFKTNSSIETKVDTLHTTKDSITLTYGNLAKGTYSLSIKNREFKPYTNTSIVIVKNKADTVTLEGKSSINIKGKVIAAYNKEGLKGAVLRFVSDQVVILDTTDINGEYGIATNKIDRAYRVEITNPPTYKALSTTINLSALEKDTTLPTLEMELVNIVLTVNVRTSDAASVNGTSVVLTPKTGASTSVTISNGKAIFDNLIPGEYSIEIEKDGYEQYIDSTVIINQSMSKDIVLKKRIGAKPMLALSVKTSTNESLTDLPIILENNRTGAIYELTLNSEGVAVFDNLSEGVYTLDIFNEGFKRYVDTSLQIYDSVNLEVILQEIIIAPYALNGEVIYDEKTASANIRLEWNEIGEYFLDSYEEYPNFALEFEPWKTIDGDKLGVVGLNGKTYPNIGAPQAATIFNPLAITPVMEDAFARPYNGQKCLAFFGAVEGSNNDWAISPKRMIRQGEVLAFMAKQLANAGEKERFAVYISTEGTNIEDFHKISIGNYLTVGAEWNLFVTDLAEYIGEEVHFAIHCSSRTKMMLMVDDFYIGKPASENLANAPRNVLSKMENEYSIASVLKSSRGVQSFEIYLNGAFMGSTNSTSYLFENMNAGKYSLGVKAIYRSGESDLKTIEVNVDDFKAISAKFTAEVTTNANESGDGTIVRITDTITKKTKEHIVTNNKVEINYLKKGVYTISIAKKGFNPISDLFVLTENKTLSYNLIETIKAPINPYVTLEYNNGSTTADAIFSWDKETGFKEGFESYADFTQDLSPWINLDYDQLTTYGLSNCTFPGAQGKLAGVVFNASSTTPPTDNNASGTAHSGKKHLVFISSQDGPCSDWLISPAQEIRDDYELRFFAKSYTDAYGLEKLNILISETDTNENSFKKVKSLELPVAWTEYKIDLSKYKDKTIYIAFNYVSNNVFYMLLDDISIGSKSEAPSLDATRIQNYNIFLNGELKATQKEREYIFQHLPTGTYKAGVQAIYASGLSDTTNYTFEVKPTSTEIERTSKTLSLYPNPVSGQNLNVKSDKSMEFVRVLTLDGKEVYLNTNVQGEKNTEIPTAKFNTGIYILEVKTSHGLEQSRFVVY